MVQHDECSGLKQGNNNVSRKRNISPMETSHDKANGKPNGNGTYYDEGDVSICPDAVLLKRRVGLLSGVALIVGTMIGSGIFVSPVEVLVRTGSVGTFLLVWLGGGIISLLGALSYAELGTMNNSAGAEYAYYLDAFGPVSAFLFSWVSSLVLKPSQLAIICLTFAQYFVEAFIDCQAPVLTVKLVCVSLICLLLFINCYSVAAATGVQNVFTCAKLVAIGIICIGGAYKFSTGESATKDFGFSDTIMSPGILAMAFYSASWSYDGWNNLNYCNQELLDQSRNLPRSIMIAIPLVTICYIFINVSYFFVMTPQDIIDSPAVAVTFASRIMGDWEGAKYLKWVVPLCVAVSTFGAANGTLFVAGRLCFATSREGQFSDILSYIHIRRFTPVPALFFHAIIATFMIIAGDIETLIDFFSFTAWIFYGGAMLAVIVQRFTRPNAPRPYKVPIIFPWIVLLASVYLVLGPIIDKPQVEYLYAILFIVAGLIFYFPFVYFKLSIKFMVPVTIFLQKLLMVAPTDSPVSEEQLAFL
ncbi:b(0,+)-type amino acid transporter 1 isoform X2 [Folsomia candida]|uniref:b(0,+)-type amino acid transporter 1 isoform X2 n=1 Tax=Folsomia candida TaxID=158441 RepID=UPI000B900237|nr:b(0,+)-type amino acid transporter 1 isoform X2 [Folsomia candida]